MRNVGNKLTNGDTMIYKVKLCNIWIFLPLLILSFATSFCLIFLLHGHLDRFLMCLIGLPFLALIILISTILSSRLKIIELKEDFLFINNTKRINVRNIDWYYEESNFLFDGIAFKTTDGKKLNLTTPALFRKSGDFKLLKDQILNREVDQKCKVSIKRKELGDYKSLIIIGKIKSIAIFAASIFWIFVTDNISLRIVLIIVGLGYMILFLHKKKASCQHAINAIWRLYKNG